MTIALTHYSNARDIVSALKDADFEEQAEVVFSLLQMIAPEDENNFDDNLIDIVQMLHEHHKVKISRFKQFLEEIEKQKGWI